MTDITSDSAISDPDHVGLPHRLMAVGFCDVETLLPATDGEVLKIEATQRTDIALLHPSIQTFCAYLLLLRQTDRNADSTSTDLPNHPNPYGAQRIFLPPKQLMQHVKRIVFRIGRAQTHAKMAAILSWIEPAQIS